MFRFDEFVTRSLEFASRRLKRTAPEHLATGERGEMEAYFYLRRLGYCIVATNFRVPQSRGEIDLVGWDKETLCFIEVKTRTDAGLAPPETAVTLEKKRHILSVARRYIRRLPGKWPPPCRFDVVSIVLGKGDRPRDISLFKGAFHWEAGNAHPYRRSFYPRGDSLKRPKR
jgi:putative endonuclease